MAWIYLIAAGLLEVLWAFTMKQAEGFTRPIPAIITLVAMAASIGLLALAMRTLPLGVSYMVWTGIGAAGSFVLGFAVLGETLTPMRLMGASLLLAGLLVTKISSGA